MDENTYRNDSHHVRGSNTEREVEQKKLLKSLYMK